VELPDSERLGLCGGFGHDAAAFDRTRPVCPPELFSDLVRLAGLEPGDRVLEIGCGTGQATLPLAERGLAVTAIELDPELARLATAKLAGFDAVEVITGSWPLRPWDTCLILTPPAAGWLADDLAALAALTGHPVRSAYKLPASPTCCRPRTR
jgi:SAM-dependent methyltransferase